MMGHRERGAGTILTVAVVAVIAVVAWGAALVLASLAQAQRALEAADLAALAGAAAHLDGAEACDAARDAARRNEARLVACDLAVVTGSFVVEVTVAVPLPPQARFVSDEVRRTATAGVA